MITISLKLNALCLGHDEALELNWYMQTAKQDDIFMTLREELSHEVNLERQSMQLYTKAMDVCKHPGYGWFTSSAMKKTQASTKKAAIDVEKTVRGDKAKTSKEAGRRLLIAQSSWHHAANGLNITEFIGGFIFAVGISTVAGLVNAANYEHSDLTSSVAAV